MESKYWQGPKTNVCAKYLRGLKLKILVKAKAKRHAEYLRLFRLVCSKTKILMGPSVQNTDGPARKILMRPIFKILTGSKY